MTWLGSFPATIMSIDSHCLFLWVADDILGDFNMEKKQNVIKKQVPAYKPPPQRRKSIFDDDDDEFSL